MDNDKFVDTCRLLGIYNDKDVYLYSSAKYDRPRLFILPIIITCLNGLKTMKS